MHTVDLVERKRRRGGEQVDGRILKRNAQEHLGTPPEVEWDNRAERFRVNVKNKGRLSDCYPVFGLNALLKESRLANIVVVCVYRLK